MGYTHYWYRAAELDKKKYAAFTVDAKKIVAGLKTGPVRLVYEYDDAGKEPVLDGNEVRFNGAGDEGHETFFLERIYEGREREEDLKFSFCKTAQKPYDIAVTAVLIAAAHHFGKDIKVSSDGDSEDWDEARRLTQELLGYGEKFSLPRDD